MPRRSGQILGTSEARGTSTDMSHDEMWKVALKVGVVHRSKREQPQGFKVDLPERQTVDLPERQAQIPRENAGGPSIKS